jgi:hypothetical protein
MSHILQSFPINYFWRFSGLDGSLLRSLIHYFAINADRAGEPSERENAEELAAVLGHIHLERIAGRVRQKTLVLGQQVYPVPIDPSARLQIWALAPSGNQISVYERSLVRCFTPDGKWRENMPYADHNAISVALLVRFGSTCLILGGDVEGPGWEDTCTEFGTAGLAALAVKVSHHGSTNGYIAGLWELISANEKPIAIITPYRRFGLPKRETLNHISQFTDQIFLTNPLPPSGASKRIPFSDKAPVKSRTAIWSTFGATPAQASTPCGRCSFVFDDQGNCLRQEVVAPATRLRQ